jgi:hypothetical protein
MVEKVETVVETVDDNAITLSANPNQIQDNTIRFFIGAPDNVEMLRIAEDGFYVRGEKVEQGEGEAKEVYDAFKAFMVAQGSL